MSSALLFRNAGSPTRASRVGLDVATDWMLWDRRVSTLRRDSTPAQTYVASCRSRGTLRASENKSAAWRRACKRPTLLYAEPAFCHIVS